MPYMASIVETLSDDRRKRYQRYWVKAEPNDILIAQLKVVTSKFDIVET